MRITLRGKTLVRAWLMICLAGSAWAQDPQAPQIVNVRGDLYTMRDGTETTVFLVTTDGIILGDPLNVPAARWLLRELAERFPGKTVRYVLHTHHHFERSGGAWVFKDTAEVVGHAKFDDALSDARQQLPDVFAALDRNRNKIIERSEIDGVAEAAPLISRDRNGDGQVRPDELYTDIQSVESTFQLRRRITSGDRHVELVYTGEGHAPDMTALYFPAERVVFSADVPSMGGAPFAFGRYTPKQLLDWVRAVMPLEFDTLIAASGEQMAKADLVEFAQYFDDLITAVSGGFEAGHTLSRVRTDLMSRPARGAAMMAAQRPVHIADVFGAMREVAVDLQVAGVAERLSRHAPYCFGETVSCSPLGSSSQGLRVGLSVQLGQLGVGVETQVQQEFAGARATAFYEDSIVHRDTYWAIPFRYTPRTGAKVGLSVVGGPTVIASHIRGFSRSRFGGFPSGTPNEINYRTSGPGFMVGADVSLPITPRLEVMVPIRYRHTRADAWTDVVTSSSLNIGAGLSWSAVRHVYMK